MNTDFTILVKKIDDLPGKIFYDLGNNVEMISKKDDIIKLIMSEKKKVTKTGYFGEKEDESTTRDFKTDLLLYVNRTFNHAQLCNLHELLNKHDDLQLIRDDLNFRRTPPKPDLIPTELTFPTAYKSPEEAQVRGSWDNWSSELTCVREKLSTPFTVNNNNKKDYFTYVYKLTLPLAPGKYQFKWKVNGTHFLSMSHPIVRDSEGNQNNEITVSDSKIQASPRGYQPPKPIINPAPPKPKILYEFHTEDSQFAVEALFSGYDVRSISEASFSDPSIALVMEWTRHSEPRIQESFAKLPKTTSKMLVLILHTPNATLDEDYVKAHLQSKGAKSVEIVKGIFRATTNHLNQSKITLTDPTSLQEAISLFVNGKSLSKGF